MHRAEYTHEREQDRKGPLMWSVLAGPLTFLGNLQTSYALVDYVCAGRTHPVWLHLTPLGYMAICVIALLGAHRAPLISRDVIPSEHKLERRQFMRQSAILLNLFFIAVLIVQWIAAFFIDPCSK
jgi:hypothetical protein